ncbi:MAG: sigma-54-dependent Fis family transcriptional regulator [Gammaproteobacteria bacterium]|nr:sigma-54-dependent Fis family transcriptional regulator [Gammaproteobacteria bacterium]MCP5443330.1 sigma-54-dependent Fis family transcriptional regulator [Chromatiaceae bacterium]
MAAISVLVIDDERNLVRSISFSLTNEGMEVTGAYTGEEGLALAEQILPDVVLLDLGLPDMSGMTVLEKLHDRFSELPVIMISAHGDTRTAVQTVKQGALDYITKPFDLDELILLIQRSAERVRMQREIHFLRERSLKTQGLVGEHVSIQSLCEAIKRVGESSAKTVLVSGPSGTGKALVAKALHDARYSDAPFIEVNCAALPEQLIEAELFGVEKGAYTGANQRRSGLIELADGGTLFLDEIGEMPIGLQVKLLSFLENRHYRPVGAGRERQADVFVVAATNRDLKKEVDEQRFRIDLYYRLNVLPLDVSSLASRASDVSLLVAHFAQLFATQEGCRPIEFDQVAAQTLQGYSWPGNVRELKNLIERLTILYPAQCISLSQLPSEFVPDAVTSAENAHGIHHSVEDHERLLIEQALSDAGGRKALAADKLGISRHALKRRMQRLRMGDYQ